MAWRRRIAAASVLARRLGDVLALVIVLAALVVGGNALVHRLSSRRDAAETGNGISVGTFARLTAGGRWIGPENAAVVILVYNDYACGFCRDLHGTLSELLVRYPQHVAVVIKHFMRPSFLPIFNIPQGAECAGEQDRFEVYHNAAFANAQFLEYSDGWLILGDSARIPNLPVFKECVRSRRFAERIEADYEEGVRLGVQGTPTLFVNGRSVVGAPPAVALDSMIAAQLPRRRVGMN